MCGLLLHLFEVGFQGLVEKARLFEVHVGLGKLILEGFQAGLKVLVGDAEDGQLVAELLVACEEELFERVSLVFAGDAAWRENGLGGFVIVLSGCELNGLFLVRKCNKGLGGEMEATLRTSSSCLTFS